MRSIIQSLSKQNITFTLWFQVDWAVSQCSQLVSLTGCILDAKAKLDAIPITANNNNTVGRGLDVDAVVQVT